MPTIDLSNNTSTTTPAATDTPVVTSPQVLPQKPSPPLSNNGLGGWNDPWQDDSSEDNGQLSPSGQKRMTPQERVTMIEKVYVEILGRNPDTRDINYYKYSTLTEDEIKKQLLTGTEHKQLLLDGRDYKKLKERALQAETRVKLLEGQILDQVEEFKQLTTLLREKNRHISELRENLNSSQNISPFAINSFEKKDDRITTKQTVHFTQGKKPEIQEQLKKEEHIFDRLKKALKDRL